MVFSMCSKHHQNYSSVYMTINSIRIDIGRDSNKNGSEWITGNITIPKDAKYMLSSNAEFKEYISWELS